MKTALLLGFCVTSFTTARGQSDSARKPDPEMHARFLQAERSRATAVGRQVPEFFGVTLNRESVPFTRNQLRQRVTLMCFWYASCNCFNPAILDSFSQVRDPRFQIVSVMPDTFMYARFVEKQRVAGWHVLLASQAIYELNFVGGYPAFMLIDSEGKVLRAGRVNGPDGADVNDWEASINGALMF